MRAMIQDGVKVNAIVTSPPYWGLRDYGIAGQFGSERTLVRHLARMRGVFRLAAQLLTEDGTFWLNYGDSYANDGKWGGSTSGKHSVAVHGRSCIGRRKSSTGLAPKNLIGMPWRIAFALQADGWVLRQDIIWAKQNPMPESVRDRCTKSHEYLFLFSKSDRYFWDFEAMQEPASGVLPSNVTHKGTAAYTEGDEHHRLKAGLVAYAARAAHARRAKTPDGWDTGPGAHGTIHRHGREKGHVKAENMEDALNDMRDSRNRRSVWTVTSEPFKGAHFATFPKALIEPCILASTRPGGVIFDPFMGSGTVAEVALSLGRRFIGCELNPAYAALFQTHRSGQMGLPL
jgi:site-specific DNA-methyltransferase (cytosine-N4-specific)